MEAAAPAKGAELRSELGVEPGEKVICCVARLARQKGQDVLIKALALLIKEKRRVRLLLAGDGDDLEELERLAARLGVSEKVAFLGRRSDISRILSAGNVYAAPSRWEGFGISLGEAMLAGIPCVGTSIAGHTDILKNGVTGIVVPLEDPFALAAGIARLLDNPDAAGKLADAAREFIKAGFTVEGMAKKYEKVYLNLAGAASK
jgi:glycosyltransferase involved in cell wall biosynthesis